MNLVLTTFGTYLHRNGEMFVIKVKEEKKEISSRKVRSILITTGASLSTDAISSKRGDYQSVLLSVIIVLTVVIEIFVFRGCISKFVW